MSTTVVPLKVFREVGGGSLWETRDNNSSTGYSSNAIPTGDIVNYLTVSYYDDYTFPGSNLVTGSVTKSDMTRGLPTGTKIYQTDGTSPMMTAMYYDPKGRMIESVGQNHLVRIDRMVNTYNFSGEVTASSRSHIGNSQTTTIANTYAYDHVGRKKQTTESINSATPTVISDLSYNEIGQLQSKSVGNNLNTTQYSYNERGWLKKMSSPIFSEELKYNDSSAPQYNGNIANQYWGNTATPNAHHYDYGYDKLNRLLSGYSDENKNEVLTYDMMGNISTLDRDNLGISTYIYNNSNSSNQLVSISGPSVATMGNYVYDVNGNATTDGRKNITMTYNFMNLVNSFSNGSQTVTNTWMADGRKIKKAGPGGQGII